MARAAPTAAALADRFFQLSLLGLVLSGYLALAGSGYLALRTLILIGLGLAGFLAIVKIAGARFGPGYILVKIVAFLELLAAALLSANLTFFLFLAAFLLLLVATLASGEVRRSTRGPMLVARGGLGRFHIRLVELSLSVAFGILALTAGLFFVLPRTAHVALNRYLAGRYQLTGFSSEVRLGDLGKILRQDTPAMHVRVIGPVGPLELKWRGAVLSSFDGKGWRNASGSGQSLHVEDARVILVDDPQRRLTGARITYEVQLEPVASDTLFFAGLPEVLWINSSSVIQTSAGSYRMAAALRERLQYGAISFLDQPLPPGSLPPREYLELPPIDPRIAALARQVTAYASSDATRAFALERYLSDNFQYTTELPAREAADPLANFLFVRRKGHCEYFASAMAVMLRTVGIPSRLATGFQGGTLNPISGWYVMRASDAHSWVEAWLPSRGWTTFDPTPPARAPRRQPLLARLFLYMDAAEMFWQDWVVNYGLERQVMLASKMQTTGRVFGSRWFDGLRLTWLRDRYAAESIVRAYGLVVLIVLGMGGALWFAVPRVGRWLWTRVRIRKVQRGEVIASDAAMLYSRMLALLKRRGYTKPAWYTPGEFARTLPPSPTAEIVAGLTSAYHALRYGGRADAAPRMAALLAELERT